MATQKQSTTADQTDDGYDGRQFEGEASNFANVARAQVTAFIDKLEVMVREGRDLIVDMDARLERFDDSNRRLTETEKQRRDKIATA